MFTGLVETVGSVERLIRRNDGIQLKIRCRLEGDPPSIGESIAVDGACLTVTSISSGAFETLAAPETVRRTVSNGYRTGRRVNIERALAATARLGGHFVQGHVDATTRLTASKKEGDSRVCRFETPKDLRALIVEKGSVALDGVSLTVSAAGPGWFEVMLIPHTLEATTLGERRPGDELNIEADVIAKYVKSLLAESGPGTQ